MTSTPSITEYNNPHVEIRSNGNMICLSDFRLLYFEIEGAFLTGLFGLVPYQNIGSAKT